MALSANGIDLSGSNQFRATTLTDNGTVVQQGAKPLADFLWNELGAPTIYQGNGTDFTPSDFVGKNGIIYFSGYEYGDTGPNHIDIMENGETGSGFYDNDTIWFWPEN